jgi:hypothetical protein
LFTPFLTPTEDFQDRQNVEDALPSIACQLLAGLMVLL